MLYLLSVLAMFLVLPLAVHAHKWWQKVSLFALTAAVALCIGLH